MAMITGGEMSSGWADLPTDILTFIADRVDPKIGILRLRSTCQTWRNSLSSPPPSIMFPLKLPIQPFKSILQLYLVQQTVYLLSSPSQSSNGGFLIRVEEKEDAPNTFSFHKPLSSYNNDEQPQTINLLDYRVSLVSQLYVAVPLYESLSLSRYPCLGMERLPIKKVVVARNFFGKGDFVVLCLKLSGVLLIWRFGDQEWTEIAANNGYEYDDIISYNGKFYATRSGSLHMIDSRLIPIDLMPKSIFGNGKLTYMVECDEKLYLVDKHAGNEGRFGVFKLDEKGRFWDHKSELNDCVFFVSDEASFSLSRNTYDGCVRNVIYFVEDVTHVRSFDCYVSHFHLEVTKVYDMETDTSDYFVKSESHAKLYRPPSSWFTPSEANPLL